MQRIIAVQILCAIAMAMGARAGAQDHSPPKEKQKSAEAASTPRPKLGVVSGRVFAITAGGDLKPARMAKVYLLSWEGGNTSAAYVYTEAITKGLRDLKVELLGPEPDLADMPYVVGAPSPPSPISTMSESQICQRQLLVYDLAILAAMKSEVSQKRTGRILSDQADEEGNFKMNVEPNEYSLVGSGRAGFNEARWAKDSVTVEPGAETSVKLAAPEKACLAR